MPSTPDDDLPFVPDDDQRPMIERDGEDIRDSDGNMIGIVIQSGDKWKAICPTADATHRRGYFDTALEARQAILKFWQARGGK